MAFTFDVFSVSSLHSSGMSNTVDNRIKHRPLPHGTTFRGSLSSVHCLFSDFQGDRRYSHQSHLVVEKKEWRMIKYSLKKPSPYQLSPTNLTGFECCTFLNINWKLFSYFPFTLFFVIPNTTMNADDRTTKELIVYKTTTVDLPSSCRHIPRNIPVVSSRIEKTFSSDAAQRNLREVHVS